MTVTTTTVEEQTELASYAASFHRIEAHAARVRNAPRLASHHISAAERWASTAQQLRRSRHAAHQAHDPPPDRRDR